MSVPKDKEQIPVGQRQDILEHDYPERKDLAKDRDKLFEEMLSKWKE